MHTTTSDGFGNADASELNSQEEISTSAVSWAAIIAGAFTATAVSLILLILGSGLGLASVSPWSNAGISATTFTVTAAIWLIVMQWFASGLGGYLTGRLRSRWANTHRDEVFFRDTAHGFLAWAVATVITAGLLASVASSVVSGTTNAVATVAAGAASGMQSETEDMGDSTGYFIDRLLRSDTRSENMVSDTSEGNVREEVMRIVMNSIKNDGLSELDQMYLTHLIASNAGISEEEAANRIEDVIMQMQKAKKELLQKADDARKAASTASIFTFLSLLIGAFVASAAAALGGRHRDD